MSDPAYDVSYYRSRESWPDFRIEVETMLRLARLSPGSMALEVGCGGGELLHRLSRVARLAVGVDLLPEALRLARSRMATGEGLLCSRAEVLPFASRTFDAVLAQHLVEHLPDPTAAFEEWRRVLRPGGSLVVVTPNAAYPDPTHFHDASHVSLFTLPKLRAALEGAGFRVTRAFSLFPYLGPGRLARSASIRLSPLARLPGLANLGRTLVVAATTPNPRVGGQRAAAGS